jgi:hypothetical protein
VKWPSVECLAAVARQKERLCRIQLANSEHMRLIQPSDSTVAACGTVKGEDGNGKTEDLAAGNIKVKLPLAKKLKVVGVISFLATS